jgi:predicted nucleic acid-binding protein
VPLLKVRHRFAADAKFGEASAEAMRKCVSEGALVACEAVWAETATAFPSSEKFRRAMANLAVSFEPLSEAAAVKAAKAWRRYRARGGRRTRIASDFLIGAHARSRLLPEVFRRAQSAGSSSVTVAAFKHDKIYYHV